MAFQEGFLLDRGGLGYVTEAASMEAAYAYVITPVAEGLELEVIFRY